MEKKLLKIDIEELCQAMEDCSYEHDYYLDLDNGEILFLSEYIDDEEPRKLEEQIEENPDRYGPIRKAEPREGYGDMVEFIATVTDDHLAELLEVAVDDKGAFRRFKDVLLNYPEERDQWFRFKDDRTLERAFEWLEDIDVTLIQE